MVIIVIMVSNFDIYFSKGPLHYQTIWAGREREMCRGSGRGSNEEQERGKESKVTKTEGVWKGE